MTEEPEMPPMRIEMAPDLRPSAEAKAKMIEILKSHGIEMSVGACGCCSSPWVTFKYKGETIIEDSEWAGFNTEGEQ